MRVHETADGHRYTVEYDRNIDHVDRVHGPIVDPKGGKTTVTIRGESGEPLAVGEAWCAPYKREAGANTNDNFCRSIGRAIALGRAVKALAS